MKQKSENRKAMPKFILTMIGALILGGALGVAIVFAEGHWAASLSAALTKALATAAPWLLTADAIINTVVVWSLYKKAQRIFKSLQDPEDEEQLDRIETILNSALIVNNICNIASYFFIGIAFCYLSKIQPMMFVLCLAAFICCMASMLIGQQKLVDFTKKLNPEKQGSVYDMKFAEKWYDSCDEAERAQICQAAFTSYKATNLTCVLLWLVLVLGNMLFDFGLMPIAVVTLIWLISTVSYCVKAMRLGKRK